VLVARQQLVFSMRLFTAACRCGKKLFSSVKTSLLKKSPAADVVGLFSLSVRRVRIAHHLNALINIGAQCAPYQLYAS